MDNSHQAGKTLILTGASRGIGHATVKRFSCAGWRVITCSRYPFPEDCPWIAGAEDHLVMDLSEPREVERAIEELRDRLDNSGVDALVNNAAISPKSANGKRLDTLNTAPEIWLRVLQVNLLAPVTLARGLVRELERNQGAIVNVTSIAGGRVHPFAGAAYAASKAALSALTREMSADFAPKGIRVNAVSPGEIKTPILSPGTETMTAQIPMGRLGSPEEVASTIYFLCSSQASYVNGAEIQINGGQHV